MFIHVKILYHLKLVFRTAEPLSARVMLDRNPPWHLWCNRQPGKSRHKPWHHFVLITNQFK